MSLFLFLSLQYTRTLSQSQLFVISTSVLAPLPLLCSLLFLYSAVIRFLSCLFLLLFSLLLSFSDSTHFQKQGDNPVTTHLIELVFGVRILPLGKLASTNVGSLVKIAGYLASSTRVACVSKAEADKLTEINILSLPWREGTGILMVAPDTKYFAETKFRPTELAKQNGETKTNFVEISPK